jgi:N-acetylmuramoyl-L-alanine amidase
MPPDGPPDGVAAEAPPAEAIPADAGGGDRDPPEEPQPAWIVDKPILWDEERIALTELYAKDHYNMDTIEIVPRMIVIHWTGGKSLKGAFGTFDKARLSGREFLEKYGQLNVSAHYLVDRDGTVYRLMPDTLMARHVIGLNHCAIGVENVGNDDLTSEQLDSNVRLVAYLAGLHDTIGYLIGHYEYLKFEGSALFIEKYPAYRTKKKDPGKEFMQELRAGLLELGVQLHSMPQDLPVPLSAGP